VFGPRGQQLRALESRIHDKDQEFLTIYHHINCNPELLQHYSLLRHEEEASITKAQELENL
jgi:hypothetical protein